MKRLRKQLNSKHARTGLAILVILASASIGLAPEQVNRVLGLIDEVQPGYVRVVEFNDGDTITVDINGRTERVRFIGVDTPEKDHPSKPVQCFAWAASNFTKNLIGSSDVRLEADPTNTNRDRYDRLLRYIYLEDGTLINAELIKQGYGFAYLSFPFQKSDEFARYEDVARQNNRGLWSGCDIQLDNGFIQTNPV